MSSSSLPVHQHFQPSTLQVHQIANYQHCRFINCQLSTLPTINIAGSSNCQLSTLPVHHFLPAITIFSRDYSFENNMSKDK
jgi:hypothetical protein